MSVRASVQIVASGILAVIATLAIDSLWLDEAFSVSAATRYSTGELWAGLADSAHPPLYYMLLHWVCGALGTSEVVVRIPSAVAYAANLIFVGMLSVRIHLGRAAAATAAALLAISPLHVWYAQEARMYTTVATAALLFCIGLAIDSWAGAALAIAALTAGLYLDFTTIPIACALLAICGVRWWRSERSLGEALRVCLVVAISALLAGPVWGQLAGLLPQLDRVTVFAKTAAVLGADHVPPIAFLVVLAVATIGVAASAVWFVRVVEKPALLRTAAHWVAILFLVAAVASVFPRGYSLKPVLFVGWPFLTIVVAWLLTASGNRALLSLSVALCGVLTAITLATPRADWRSAVRVVDANHSEGDVVWLDPYYNALPYEYYRPKLAISSASSLEGTALALPSGRTIWFIAERFGNAPPTSSSEQWLDSRMSLVATVPTWRLEIRQYGAK